VVSKLRVGEKRLERNQVRRLLIAGVMLALAGLGFVLGRTMVGQQQVAVQPSDAPDLQPDVTQRIKEFRRVKVKDGRKEWELTAQEAELFTELGEVAITGPKLAFYSGDGRNVEIKGKEGRVFLTDGNVQRIELSGGIDVTVGDYFVQTEKAIYFENINSIAAPGEVRLKGSDIALAGQAMLLELGSQKVLFRKGVVTTFQSARDDTAAKSAPVQPVHATVAGPPVQAP
jgi:LPS export ABC transporter protein LptC